MQKSSGKISRREQILAALAKMLESSPGERITTSAIAKEVGVSEAALYRHFPSKTKMFEGLIVYIEETFLEEFENIVHSEDVALDKCRRIIFSLLIFSEENPGLARLLSGEALNGETERLRIRISHFFNRVTVQITQLLQFHTETDAHVFSHLLMSYADGCIIQFVRSEFRHKPTLYWTEHWQSLSSMIPAMSYNKIN